MYGTPNKLTGLTVDEIGHGKYRTTVYRFSGAVIPLTDNAGVAAGANRKLYTFPACLNDILSVVSRLQFTRQGTGVNATFNGDLALGTVAAALDATLTGTEADVLASAPIGPGVAGVATSLARSTAVLVQDGTAVAKALYLNLLVDDADQDVTTNPSALVVDGTIEINWLIGQVKFNS